MGHRQRAVIKAKQQRRLLCWAWHDDRGRRCRGCIWQATWACLYAWLCITSSCAPVCFPLSARRIILPCSPLIPCAKGQIDTAGLLALRHLALRTALHIIKIYNSMQPIDAATGALLQQLLSEGEWSAMRSSLMAALQELVDAFPMDYYPAGAPPDRQHLSALQGAVEALKSAWQEAAPALKQQQVQQQQWSAQTGSSAAGEQGGGGGEQQQGAAAADHAAVTLASQGQHTAAAAAAVFKDPLVLEGTPATQLLTRMNTIHLIKLLEDLVLLLEQLYDTVEQVGEHMVSCRCC